MKTVNREAFAQALKRVRLLALDIDGTILTDDKRLTKRTASAIRGASEKGIQVVLVTGRPLSGIPQALADISGIRFAITSNGAATTDRIRKTRLRSACLKADTACAIARIPMEKGLVHSVFLDDYGFCEPAFFEMQRALYASTPIEQYFRASRRETDSIERTIRASRAGVENIWMIAKDRAQRDEIDRRVRGQFDVQTVLTAETHVEIGSKYADKGLALSVLAEMLGIEKGEILALGDNENDLGMFRAAGLCAAMGNGTESAKAQADFITDSNACDGAAKLIERLL